CAASSECAEACRRARRAASARPPWTGRLANGGAGAPPFPGTRLDARRLRPQLIILNWSPSRLVVVHPKVAVEWDLSRERFGSGSEIFRVVLGPLQSARALRLHRTLRRRRAVHWLCARPACARTGA